MVPLKDGKNLVKTKDKESVDDKGLSKKVNAQTCHLRSFIISQSKRFMKDVVIALEGFKYNKSILRRHG